MAGYPVYDKEMGMNQRMEITDIGANGDGVGRTPEGAPVFVPFTMLGDVVNAKVDKDGDVWRGQVVSFEKKSEARVEPPCRHFTICGGCALQHVNEAAYQEFKKRQIKDALEKSGVDAPEKIDAVFIPYGTRRRANFAAIVTKRKTVIGFHERKSATVRDVPDCLLITEEVRAVMEGFRPFVADIAGDGAKMDILIQCVDGSREIALTGKIAPGWEAQQALSDALRTLDLARISIRARDYESYELLLEAKGFYKRFDSLNVNLAPGAFLQPSAEGERALTELVLRGVGDASCIADLFCGNGTFTGPLMGRDIIAADFAADAIASLKKAGVRAQMRNLFKDPMRADELEGRDCVILDPPRAGASTQINVLAELDIPKIVYVSCSPQSFARDASILIKGGYRLDKLTLVDQFIWSPHTELVGVFEKGR